MDSRTSGFPVEARLMTPARRHSPLTWIQAGLAAVLFFLLQGAALLKDARRVAADRDWNHVNDFRGGVPEMYQLTTAPGEERR